jgi:hypothetical protein
LGSIYQLKKDSLPLFAWKFLTWYRRLSFPTF